MRLATLDTQSKFRGASLVGNKYDRLAVVKYAGKDRRLQPAWECLCDCGSLILVAGYNLTTGNTRSCGCLARELSSESIPLEERTVTFWENVAKLPNGCWEWTGALMNKGYGIFHYNKKDVLAHRFSWLIHHGDWPKKPFVCHDCPGGDNPKCVNPDHLFEGTALDNIRDSISKGHFPPRMGRPQIAPEKVIQIRKMYGSGEFSHQSLADRLSLRKTQIISALKKWKTLPLYALKES